MLQEFGGWLWRNRTRTFAFIQGLVAILAGMTNVFQEETLKWLLVGNAVLTYALGQFNAWQANKVPPPEEPPTGA